MKEISKLYKGTYAIGPLLISLLTGSSNQLNSFTRLLFQKTPILTTLYVYMPMWINGVESS